MTVVSLAPPLVPDKPGPLAWWWRAAAGDVNLFQPGSEALGLSRLPLPGVVGPLGNYSLLQRFLRTRQRRRFDLCLASGPVPGLVSLKTSCAPVVYEDLDCYGAYGRDPFRRWLITGMETYCFRHASAVVSVGSVLANRALRHRAGGVHVVPNGVDLDLFAGIECVREKELVVVHGSIERSRSGHRIGLESGLRALRLLRDSGIQVRMEVAGRGPALGHFQTLTAALGLTDVVTFRGHLSYKEVAGLLARATVGLLSFPDTPFMRCGATLKLAECMASGLPVVATDVGETAATVRRTGAGVVVGPSPEQIAKGMATLFKDPALRKRLGRQGRRAAERLDWNNLAEEEANVLLQVLEHSGHKPAGAEYPSPPMGTSGG